MAGQDKGWVELRGRPLIAHVLERFAPQVGKVVISANRNLDRYAALNVPVLPDLLPGYQGPLAGLQAALYATDTPLLACVPCDAPSLPLDLVVRLRTALCEGIAQVAVARAAGRVHPVFCLCRREVRPALDAALAAGERKLEAWCRSVRLVEVTFEDEQGFRNLNRPDDLEAAGGG